MRYICFHCFEDLHLRRIIQRDYQVLKCSLCGQLASAISILELGKLIEPIMRQHFQLGEVVTTLDEHDHTQHEQIGDDLSSVIQEVLGQHFEFEEEIIDAVIEAEDCWPPDGEEPFWDATSMYEPIAADRSDLVDEWLQILKELKHARRFFSLAAKNFFDKVFHDLDQLTVWVAGDLVSVLKDIPTGTKLFRARQCLAETELSTFFADPLGQIGPPPPEFSRAGRMNADGVTVLYSSIESETCLSELRPAIGSRVVLIALETVHPLRLLDFNLLEVARHRKNLSYFQSDFDEQISLRVFWKHLHRLIANPVAPGHESDYLITQVMTEYLTHVSKHDVDGIQFRSAQKVSGNNIVLFSKPATSIADRFPVRYIPDSIQLHETQSISYVHRELRTYSIDGRVCTSNCKDWENL